MVTGGAAACASTGWLANEFYQGNSKPNRDNYSNAASFHQTLSRRVSWALGSNVALTVIHPDANTRKAALDDAFAAIERVEEVMSIYRPNSELSRLNAQRKLIAADPWLIEVLQFAQSLSDKTDGAFDITVQPLWSLYDSAQKRGVIPSDSEIAVAISRVDWRQVECNEASVRIQSDQEITLNGIAQGFACDQAMSALRFHGIEHALVDTGELAAQGQSEQDRSWRIGIRDPRKDGEFASVAKLDGRCLATSGDYATHFTDDKRHHHLFDPTTGKSSTKAASVSVAAPTGMQADALSTAIFVLGAKHGLELIAEMPDVDAFIIDRDGKQISSANFPA